MNHIAIIIPTYNESKNILRLVEAIDQTLPKCVITIVDDNSPDGTGTIIKSALSAHPNLQLIARKEKQGRGSAVLAGMRLALQNKQTTHCIEMDADFSHDPKELSSLIRATKKADFVIAARYVQKSRIINWPMTRHIFSFCANLFAKLVLQVPIHDYTNGYRCYTRQALEIINLDGLKETGYALLMEMVYIANLRHLRIAEISTVFVNRRRGQSNTNLREITNALNAPLRIRQRHV